MNMWFVIIGLMLAVFASGLVYTSFRAAHFAAVQRIARGRKWLARMLCLGFFVLLSAILWVVWNMMNVAVCMIHLVLFWLLCDFAAFFIAKIRKKPWRRYWAGAVAIALCTLWLIGGWIAAHHVWTTTYTFETGKLDRDIRIVQISDSHIGATFDATGFLKHIEGINGLSPDVVVITGDLVDDDTSREDMLSACDALGRLTAPKGVFFVYGNHDKGYFSESNRGWTNAELRSGLEQNGVIVLEDESIQTGDGLCIVGRKDRSEKQRGGERMTAEELLSKVDREQYIVMLDHQPHDFDGEAAAGADLVLCGHTHGGQFIPISHIGEWIGENDLRYGHERRGGTDFIVSSGISNWTFKFKTGCRSEIVVVDIIAAGSEGKQ